LSIALATALLLSLERLRTDIRSSFSQAVSGTDLVVGARTGPVQLMLYAVFRVGGATNNIGMDSVRAIAEHRAVAWVVPMALGDSHRGHPVLGTTPEYFVHFAYGDRQPLALAQGRAFTGTLDGLYEAVLGSRVAQALGYKLGQRITLTHGWAPSRPGGALAAEHADKPFTVVGVLARTGTPVDRTVHVSLQAIEAIHLDWVGGAPLPASAGVKIAPEMARKFDSAAQAGDGRAGGLKNRVAVFNVQRFVNGYGAEPLLAVLPGVALDELWAAVGLGEKALLAISGLVALVSLASLVAVVLAGLNERRRELAVLRAVGAGPRHVLVLLAAEGALVTLAGALLGAAVAALAVWGAGPWVQQQFGITLLPSAPTGAQWGAVWGRGAGGYACQPRAGLARLPSVIGRRAFSANLMKLLAVLRFFLACGRLLPCPACAGPAQCGVPLMKPPLGAAASSVRCGHQARRRIRPARHHHLGRPGACQLGPVQGLQGPEFPGHGRRRPACSRDDEAHARGVGQRARQQRHRRQAGAHPGFCGAAGRQQGRPQGVPARALFRRLHPQPAAAQQPDRARAAQIGGQGCAVHGRGVDHRHLGHRAHRQLHGRGQLPH
jgi:putative ABC transport system permease protein